MILEFNKWMLVLSNIIVFLFDIVNLFIFSNVKKVSLNVVVNSVVL